MATSTKFDISSTSPDRPLYTGQRGSHIVSSLDRSGNFCESMENSSLSSLPNMSRSSSSATRADVVNFFNCVRLDLKHKSNRQIDFKQHISAALGISADESPSSSGKGKQLPTPAPEDIKRLKDGLQANFRRARERSKMFGEALSRFNKDFQNITSKKRSRPETFSNERSSFTLNDRSVLGPSTGKAGVQGLAVPGGSEHELPKLEERTKNVVTNKRTRTSLVDAKMDVRANPLVRTSGTVDRDKEMSRISYSDAVQGEERTVPIGRDGWEKSKMKKKRSGIKPDGTPNTPLTKPVNIFRETKQGMQQRLATDTRSKLNNDSHSFRTRVSNGTLGSGKSDGVSQQPGLGIRMSNPRSGPDNNSVINDKRDRFVNSDKEKVNFRAVNKAMVRDEFNSASPNSNSKMNASIRAPRSGLGVGPKLSPVVHRAAIPNDWELSNCMLKHPNGVGTNNRKRVVSVRSSSPPVVQWQRPQKSSRTARRTNFVAVVSNNDDSPALDSVSDVTAALSESEESGVGEIKPKEKPEEIDQKAGQNVRKISHLVLPTRKSKLVSGEEHRDGVRRQGRTGRNFPATTSLMPMTSEKLGNVGTVKQLRSSRLGLEKSESRVCRPPTRKLSDCKAYASQKHTSFSASADFLVGSEDGHEELLAAVKGVINSAHAFSNQFWRQMEPFFCLITEEDIAYWKQKVNFELSGLTSPPTPSNIDECEAGVNGFDFNSCERDLRPSAQKGAGILVDQSLLAKGDPNGVSLCQRLMSALISEECPSESDDIKITRNSGHDETGSGIVDISSTLLNSSQNMLTLTCSELQYDTLDMNEKLLLELQSIGIAPGLEPEISQTDEGICDEITRLEEHWQRQISKSKYFLAGLLKSASVTKELQEKEFEQRALDKIVVMAYEKYMACWGPSPSGGKNASNKMAKQAALGFVKRALEWCHQYEDTGKSCFSEPLFKDMFLAALSQLSSVRQLDGMEAESAKPCASSFSLEARIGSLGSQQSPSQFGQNMNIHDFNSSDILPSINNSSEQTSGKEGLWSIKVKKREVSLDDVGCTVGSSNAPSGLGSSLSNSVKGKRSERDRDGKGQSREVQSRNGTAKVGRPALSSAKGERKPKTKPKQKATQHSVSVNGLLGKLAEQPKRALPSALKSNEMSNNNNAKDEFGFGELDEHEPIDLSNLQLPGMDVLGVPDDLGDQGEDFGSWLNIEDDGLQDHDFMGLEIPMDDLSDLNMMI